MSVSINPKISIVMPVYDKCGKTVDYHAKATRSIEQFTTLPYELIAIDNNSPMRSGLTAEQQADLYGRKTVVSFLRENIGFGPACNLGFQMAKGSYVSQMNTDVELIENTFDILVAVMERNPDIAVIMPEHYENCQHYLQQDPVAWSHLQKSDTFMPDWRFGALWVARENVIREVNGFDPAFKMCYWEDSDLWQRILRRFPQMRICGYRGTWVKHVGGASSIPDRDKFFVENQRLYESRYGPIAS